MSSLRTNRTARWRRQAKQIEAATLKIHRSLASRRSNDDTKKQPRPWAHGEMEQLMLGCRWIPLGSGNRRAALKKLMKIHGQVLASKKLQVGGVDGFAGSKGQQIALPLKIGLTVLSSSDEWQWREGCKGN